MQPRACVAYASTRARSHTLEYSPESSSEPAAAAERYAPRVRTYPATPGIGRYTGVPSEVAAAPPAATVDVAAAAAFYDSYASAPAGQFYDGRSATAAAATTAPVPAGTAAAASALSGNIAARLVHESDAHDRWGRSVLEYRHVGRVGSALLRTRPMLRLGRTALGVLIGDALAGALEWMHTTRRRAALRFGLSQRTRERLQKARKRGDFNWPAAVLLFVGVVAFVLPGVWWWRSVAQPAVARTLSGVDDSTALSVSALPEGAADDVGPLAPTGRFEPQLQALPGPSQLPYDTTLRAMNPAERAWWVRRCVRMHGATLATAGASLRSALAVCDAYEGDPGACTAAWLSGRAGSGPTTLTRLLALHAIAANVTRDFVAAHRAAASAPSTGYAIAGKSFAREECILVVRPSEGSRARAFVRAGATANAYGTLFLVNPTSLTDDTSGTWYSRTTVEVWEDSHLYPQNDPRKRLRPTWIRIDALLFDPTAPRYEDAFAVHSFNFSGNEAGAVYWASLLNAGQPE